MLVKDIDKLLPQTQCTKCGYKDCKDYAQAIVNGEKHNRCPPGGDKVILDLSNTLSLEKLPLDESCGKHLLRTVAVINEDLCIGCTKCIDACPVDAIIGSKKQMHTVFESECTGCDLCVEPCPMDCIDMVILPEKKQPSNLSNSMLLSQKNHFRNIHEKKKERILAENLKIQNSSTEQYTISDKQSYIKDLLKNLKDKKSKSNKNE